MFNQEALEYLVGLGRNEMIEINGHNYSTKRLQMVKEPIPAELEVTTLTGLVDYLKNKLDRRSEMFIVHVKNPNKVALYSTLRKDAERETYMICKALTPNNICFDSFMDTEQFNIMLQSSFVENKDRSLLLKVTGCVKDEAVKQIGDDGVSQAATIKTGVASVNDVKVPNPVVLAPFRTFPEIEQPESKFIFRMQSGPRAALFEADGGAWRNKAIASIKEYLEEQLKGIKNVQIIA
ncbi:hypothetical protein HAHI6034_05665 [Hathewaya histolytica]|uniref:Phage protein n=1 Tax=Hathewaya histolytica TaxID=1498 RepID=A0A4U9RDV6_HATHI|nr:hypothetical protein [Hathewaya histolytica]VTQ89839.1 Uncharacterised protein [Hathewaya histolytica]